MLKNVAKVLFSNAMLALVGLINSFLFPIILTVNEYAYYQQYILYVSYINICHLGIASGMFLNYAGKEYSSVNKKQYKSEIYLLLLVLSIFSLFGLIATGVSGSKLLLFVVLTIIPQCVIASFQSLYQAWERFTEYSIINALPKIIFTIVSIIVFVSIKQLTGDIVVIIYLAIQWIICMYFIFEFVNFTRGYKSNYLFSVENKNTTINGFLIMFGNYVNLLFHSIDKQFVNILYSTLSFAQYSFAMATQNIMMIFITSLANPFYPRLAKGDIDDNYIKTLKEVLFMFGAYSGCAYFAVSFIVERYVTKYIDSLNVISLFFAVFPAMAVINVLYINMYKIQKKFKKYIFTLFEMLVVAFLLNVFSVFLNTDYYGIAFATMLSYYIWLFYSQKHFDQISITKNDIAYLIGFFIIYYFIIRIPNTVIGFAVYTLIISIWNILLYGKTIFRLKEIFLDKFVSSRR